MKEQYRPLVYFFVPLFWLVSIVMLVENLALGITLNLIWIIGVIVLALPISRPKIPNLNIEPELEQIYKQFYETVIFPKERERKVKGLKQKVLKIFCVLGCIIATFGFFMAIAEDDKYLIIFFIGAILFIVSYKIWERIKIIRPSSKNEFVDIILPNFIQRMIPGVDFNYTYRNWKKQNSQEVKMVKSMLEMEKIQFNSEFTVDYDLTIDYDFGWVAENNNIQKLYNICEKREEKTAHIPLSRRRKNTITISYDGLFGWNDINCHNNIIKITPNVEYKYVNSEDKVKKHLKIWAQDEVSAEMFLPRVLLEYLANLYEKTGIDFEIRFKNNKIFYKFNKGHDIKINELNKEEYKRYLFTYYYAVKIMQETSRIMQEKLEGKTDKL